MKKLLFFFLSLIFLTVAILFAFKHREEAFPEFILTYADNQLDDHPSILGAYYFSDLVKERSDGRIKIQIYSDGILGSENSVIEQIQFGGIDFARVSISVLSGFIPSLTTLQLPYLFDDSDHMWRVLNGEIGESLKDEISSYGFKGLSWYDAGSRNFYTTTKIESIEGLQGLKIRIQPSKMMNLYVEALGAIPVEMEYSDVYSALEQGEIEGAENNLQSYAATEHYRVASYLLVDEHSRIPEVQLISEVTWNKLSPSDQQLILECAQESAEFQKNLWKETEERSQNFLEENGVSVTELSSKEKERFQEAILPLYQNFEDEYFEIIKKIKES